ncbi:MAG TPA: aminotransferase class III-fold pyridoxal phosphate-dependent enzyme [Devosiaceae bacterium]|nr:aminotransferase class III-fold pyridoxal phosphate-dependent enzyme [Devosiaceae bacterium]
MARCRRVHSPAGLAGFWQEVRKACDAFGAMLIFDEIPTGLGKTGKLFSSEHQGVKPDITVLGKSLGGGMLPLAAVIADPSFDIAPELSLGHYTHEKNPGVFEPYEPKDSKIRPDFRDPDGFYSKLFATTMCMVVNTKRLADKHLPSSPSGSCVARSTSRPSALSSPISS